METFKKHVLKGISKDEVRDILRRIAPLHRDDETDELHYVHWEGVDVETIAFLWEPKLGQKVEGLREVSHIKSAHTFGAPVFFKPSLMECAAQIRTYVGIADAFEVVTPDNEDGIYFYLTNGGALLETYPVGHDPLHNDIAETLHKAKITLYKKADKC